MWRRSPCSWRPVNNTRCDRWSASADCDRGSRYSNARGNASGDRRAAAANWDQPARILEVTSRSLIMQRCPGPRNALNAARDSKRSPDAGNLLVNINLVVGRPRQRGAAGCEREEVQIPPPRNQNEKGPRCLRTAALKILVAGPRDTLYLEFPWTSVSAPSPHRDVLVDRR